jgi:uncharacterized protein (TIGR02300 family)
MIFRNVIMTQSSLGTKHICGKCSTKFYDMQKTPAKCPKCGTEVVDEIIAQPIVSRIKADKKLKNINANEMKSIKLTADMDSIPLIDDEDDLKSLSELDDRPAHGHQHAGHDDDVEEADLMEERQGYDVILDDAKALGKE